MRKRTKTILLILSVLLLVFIFQNRIRLGNDCVCSIDTTEIRHALEQQSKTSRYEIIPPQWYGCDGFLTPSVAGMLDGGWQMGVGIYDLTSFVNRYSTDAAFREEVDSSMVELYEQRNQIYTLAGQELSDYGATLAGKKGGITAEYEAGKIVFELATLVVGLEELQTLNKTLKISERTRRFTQKIARLETLLLECPPCATFFRASAQLRNNLLQNHLSEIRLLLHDEFLKSGKTWELFLTEYEAHHIIPVNLLSESKGLKFYYANGGTLQFNSIENGIMVKKVCLGGVHANHPAYNQAIMDKLDFIYSNIKNGKQTISVKIKLFDIELRQMIEDVRTDIIRESVEGKTFINNLYRKKL